MLVRYWQPLREMETLRRQFDRVFDELSFATNESAWSPAIELRDLGDAIELRAQLPGLNAKDIDIQVSREAVAIVGEYRQSSQSENNSLLNSEFRYGKFQRVISLPVAVINDQVKADYKDGVLTLMLPKVTEARNTVVKLNLAELSQSSETQVPGGEALTAQEQAAQN